MREEELDAAIAGRFKAYAANMRLPCGFKDRFIGSVRRKRAMRRAWMLGMVCAAVAAGVAIMNFARPVPVRGGAKPVLTARTAPADEDAAVSYWMLLGYLRECFGRSRPARRKEDE